LQFVTMALPDANYCEFTGRLQGRRVACHGTTDDLRSRLTGSISLHKHRWFKQQLQS
jgi:hypothetical protein